MTATVHSAGGALIPTVPAGHGPVLSAELLGGCRVTLAGVPVDTTSSRRTRTLLAYLLVHGRAPVPCDVLTGVLWPAARPDVARDSLDVALAGLRQALRTAWPDARSTSGAPIESAVVLRPDGTCSFAPEVAVRTDVNAFTAAVEEGRRAPDPDVAAAANGLACHLYAGDFLPTDPYLEWAVPMRTGLRTDALDARRALLAHHLGRGDHGVAAVLARAVLAVDPTDEAAHRALMVCLAADGQRHLALAQYQRMARMLWRSFGTGPDAESTALYERLRGPARSVSAPGRSRAATAPR